MKIIGEINQINELRISDRLDSCCCSCRETATISNA